MNPCDYNPDSCASVFGKIVEKLDNLEKVQTTRTNGRVTELEHRMEVKDRVDDKQSDSISKIKWTVAWAAGFGAAVGTLASLVAKFI